MTTSNDTAARPTPTTIIGVLVLIVDRFGLAALGLVSFVVVVMTIVIALRSLGPDLEAIRAISAANAAAAQSHIEIQRELRDTAVASRTLLEGAIKLAERLERTADRIERAAGSGRP